MVRINMDTPVLPAFLVQNDREEPSQEDVVKKLEAMCHRIGESLVERVSRDTPRFKSELNAVILIYKSFLGSCFRQAD